jgi:hypothetical protein
MAKRQKSIWDAYFAMSHNTDYSTSDNIIFVHSPNTTQEHYGRSNGRFNSNG